MKRENRPGSVFIPVIIALSLIAGIGMGWLLPSGRKVAGGAPSAFSQSKTGTLIHLIESRYVDEVDRNKLEEAAIPVMLKNLDPHSVYIPAKDLTRANEQIQGNFEGIGISFNMITDTLLVISTIPGGPSEKAGLMAGDRIIEVNDSVIAGRQIPDERVIGMLRGPKGTRVSVKVERRGIDELLAFEIVRDKIPIYTVDVAYMIRPGTGYIKISSFAMTTFNEFLSALRELKGEGMDALILDLRGNSGGVMEAAARIADQFLPGGSMIVYTEGRAFPREEILATRAGEFLEGELIILIDEWSASASEIVAGAVQDNDRGTIIGRRSFGKGLVQEPLMFSDGSGLRLTIARYYTPTGRSIQKPYSDGYDDYYNDLNERYMRGEFEEADSINLPDSLRFTTPGGRTVFGGGGIMPDIFIPLDTTKVTDYFIRVRNSGTINRFALRFTEDNREKLSSFSNVGDLEKHLDSQNLMDSFIGYAESSGITADRRNIGRSDDLIHTQLKAYIARNILDNKGFYPIWEKLDNTLLRAVDYLVEKSGGQSATK